MAKIFSRKAIRPEDVLAFLMILPSIWVARQPEYYYLFNGNIVMSKHLTGFLLLLVLAIVTALYENRIQRIIDTIKSGVKIPQVSMEDQLVHLWKTKYRILQVARDYLPFLICIVAYHSLQSIMPQFGSYRLDEAFIYVEKLLVEPWRTHVINWFSNVTDFKTLMTIAYKTYILSVPILAGYLYMIKDLQKFRNFLLAVVIGSIVALLINAIMPSMSLDSHSRQLIGAYNGTVSLPAVYSTVVLFFAFKIGRTLGLTFVPLAVLSFMAELLTYSNYLTAVLIGFILGALAVPLAKYIGGKF